MIAHHFVVFLSPSCCLFCCPSRHFPQFSSPAVSLKFHVAPQFSASSYDACVFRSSSVPHPSEFPLIRSSFRIFFCLIHYTARPHVVYVEFFCLALLRQLLWCSIGIRDHRGDPTTVTLLISCSHFCIEFSWVGVACRGTPLHSM